jgi:hypothetical protein
VLQLEILARLWGGRRAGGFPEKTAGGAHEAGNVDLLSAKR